MSNSSNCCPLEAPILDKILPPILIIEFIFGLTGNILVLSVFAFQVKSWKPNSIYLAHLAVADAVLLFFMPFRADYYLRGKNWIFGDAFCRIVLFCLASSRAASIFFLTTVAVDRYLKIVYPLHRLNRMSLRYAICFSAGIWAVVILAKSHLLETTHLASHGNHTQCQNFNICLDNNSKLIWHNTFYVIQFSVPGIIIIICTACITRQLKTNRMDNTGKFMRAVHLVSAVSVVYFICFLPSTASRVAIWILKLWYHECSQYYEANVAFYISICFTYFNSMLNPLVYYFATPAFSGIIQQFFRRITGQHVTP